MMIAICVSILLSIVLAQTKLESAESVSVIAVPGNTPTQYTNCRVNFCAHGDDDIQLDLSQDGGSTYPTNLVPLIPSWQTPLSYTHPGTALLSTDTRFRFTVTDSWYDPKFPFVNIQTFHLHYIII